MGKVRILATILTGVFFIPILYFGFVFFLGIAKDYEWTQMDWNRDNFTSIGEVFMAADTDIRPVYFRDMKCIEIISLKDGLTLKVRCGSVEIEPIYFKELKR